MNRTISHSGRERGQSLALIALMLAGLVAFVGLALDGGQVFEVRRQMQNSADSAALAGARDLSNCLMNGGASCREISARIQAYGGTVSSGGSVVYGNGADKVTGLYILNDGGTSPIGPGAAPGNAQCVRVTSSKTFSTLIISFLGFDKLSATATATACTGPPTAGNGVRPIGVYKPVFDTLNPGDTVVLIAGNKPAAPGSACAAEQGTLWLGSNSGSFAWYDLNGGNNSDSEMKSWVLNGYQNWISVPQNIQSDVGWRAATQPAWDSVIAGGGEIFIPIYDYVNQAGGGNLTYHIVDFAVFKVQYANMTNGANTKCIKMTFEYKAEPTPIDKGRHCDKTVLTCGVSLTD